MSGTSHETNGPMRHELPAKAQGMDERHQGCGDPKAQGTGARSGSLELP